MIEQNTNNVNTQIADCICDWLIARAKGYDVD